MTARYPLVLNGTSIQELQSGDTLLRTLSGLKDPSQGSASWNGSEILGTKPEDLVRQGISHVSEGKSVIPELSRSEEHTSELQSH